MVSAQFIIFSAIVLLLYYTIAKRWQWLLLFLASLGLILYVSPKASVLTAVTTVSVYFLGIALDRKNAELEAGLCDITDSSKKKELKESFKKRKQKYVLAAILITLGILCVVKLSPFTIDLLNDLFLDRIGKGISLPAILVPVGLSYYSFKAIGYIVDIYRGRIKAQTNICRLALFLIFFPTLTQGPIDRYEDTAEQFFLPHPFDYKNLSFGAQRILWGYMKKLIFADRINVVVSEVFGGEYQGFYIVIAALLAGIQTYADFSGGIDVTLGLAECMGLKLTENFRQPYMAKSVSEFWQRWHITLGAWMGKYVFYPISLSKPFSKLGKKAKEKLGPENGKIVAPSIASFIVFFLVGIWHGVGTKYIIYGLYQAFFVSTNTLFSRYYERMRGFFRIDPDRKSWQIFQMARTLIIITIGRMIVRADSADHIFSLFRSVFGEFNIWIFFDDSLFNLGLDRKNFILMLFSILVLAIVDIVKERGIHIRETIAGQRLIVRWTIYYLAVFALLIFGMYGPAFEPVNFVYGAF